MTLAEYVEGLKAAADEYGRIDAYVSGAKLLGKLVADLEPIANGEAGEPITLARAAEISGYSAEHIGRLVRQGKVSNVGRKGAPRVLARDLPRRPGMRLAARPAQLYDPNTDARFLRVRR
jgi:hypothetical protein